MLEGAFRNGNTVDAAASPNKQYILLIMKDQTAIILDQTDKNRSLILVTPEQISATTYLEQLLQKQKTKRLANYGFSNDSRFFAFTVYEPDSGSKENGIYLTDIIDLQTMTRQKIEFNGSYQCKFVGFNNHQVWIQWIIKDSGVNTQWFDLPLSLS